MAFCPKCGTAIEDGATFCPNCGNVLGAAPAATENYDHTAEFDPQDISENKVYAMLIYLLGLTGALFAMLGAKDSAYAQFHLRQGMKMIVANLIVAILSGILCWTFIVPIAGGIAMLVIFVLKVIAFFQICSGKAVEPAIIRNLGFLK